MARNKFLKRMAVVAMSTSMTMAMAAPVMAAGVKDVTADGTSAASAAATGLVQTTLPTDFSDQATLAAFQQAYKDYDAHVEDELKKLDKNDVASNVEDAVTEDGKTISVLDATVPSVTYHVKPGVFSITPATGNTAATAGTATIPVTFTVDITTGTGSSATTKPIERHLSLDVKWGTDVQDALAEAVQLTKDSIEKKGVHNATLYENAPVVNPTTQNFDASKVKYATTNGVVAGDTTIGVERPDLKKNAGKGYTVDLAYVSADNYVAPTSTAAGGYDVTLNVKVTRPSSGTPSVATAVTANQDVKCHVTLAKLGNVRVTSVAKSSSPISGSVWHDHDAVSGNYTVKEAGKEYPIDIEVSYTKADGSPAPAAGTPTSKEDVKAAGVTVSLKDNSVAHLVDSTTANTGKAIVFDKVGSAEIDFTTPYYKNDNSTDSNAVTSKTDKLGTVKLLDEGEAFGSVLTSLDKTVTSAEVSKADDVEAAVKAKVQAAYDAYYGKATKLDLTVKDVRNFNAAVAGTAEDPDGTNGSFYVTVDVKNDKDTRLNTSTSVKWTITADKYTDKFTDVADTDYFAKAVAWGVDKNIVKGTSATTFSPKAPVTRAQFVTFLYRQAGSPDVKINSAFTDIAGQSEEFQKAISWAASKQITTGKTATTFAPTATVTREEAVTFLFRYTNGKATTKTSSFKDVKDGAYYVDAINWGSENGVVNGFNADTFGVGANTNRGDAITFIYRALKG